MAFEKLQRFMDRQRASSFCLIVKVSIFDKQSERETDPMKNCLWMLEDESDFHEIEDYLNRLRKTLIDERRAWIEKTTKVSS